MVDWFNLKTFSTSRVSPAKQHSAPLLCKVPVAGPYFSNL